MSQGQARSPEPAAQGLPGTADTLLRSSLSPPCPLLLFSPVILLLHFPFSLISILPPEGFLNSSSSLPIPIHVSLGTSQKVNTLKT